MHEGPWWNRGERYVVPVVRWTGPDGRVRCEVPRGTREDTPAPPVGDEMAIVYDPRDPGRLALPGSAIRNPGWLAAGVASFTVGLVVLVLGVAMTLLIGRSL